MNDDYDNLLPSLLTWLKAGKKVAIATLVEISGGSPRPVGSQLLVSDTGETLGAISSGCVEADIALAAQDVITNGQVRHYNYGADSPFIDLTLPCGSSIKIVVNIAPSIEWVDLLCQQLQQRKARSITLDLHSGQWLESTKEHNNDKAYFVCHYLPQKRLVAIGKGVILEHVIQIAAASGLEVHAYSPDYLENNENQHRLTSPQSFEPTILDSATAVLVLFHDHDWEPLILQKLLKSNVSYIGVLGSFSSHQQRNIALQSLGCSEQECQRITSPAGLIKGTRHPQHIALSMVAEAVSKLC